MPNEGKNKAVDAQEKNEPYLSWKDMVDITLEARRHPRFWTGYNDLVVAVAHNEYIAKMKEMANKTGRSYNGRHVMRIQKAWHNPNRGGKRVRKVDKSGH